MDRTIYMLYGTRGSRRALAVVDMAQVEWDAPTRAKQHLTPAEYYTGVQDAIELGSVDVTGEAECLPAIMRASGE